MNLGILGLFAGTIFSGAALLFLMEPMFARTVLPLLGGSPAVWNTTLVFFQAALFAGYAYAYAMVARLTVRRQAVLHFGVLLLPLGLLPVAIPSGWTPPEGNPVWWLLALMAITVGLPFFVVSATSPILQTWFGATRHRSAADPYFLYAASNLGSMLGLLCYPFLIEPNLPLGLQGRLWKWGYLAFAGLMAGCAGWTWKDAAVRLLARPIAAEPPPAPGRAHRLRWMLLAFVPSSFLLSVTLYLSSEVAPVPLLWIVPMAIYLLTFILAFSPRQPFRRTALGHAVVLLIPPLVLVMNLKATQPLGWLMLLHLAVFFAIALTCHTDLAASRPPPSHLAGFYLWIALGAGLGSAFNALLAPLLFRSVAEYPLMLVVACAVCVKNTPGSARFRLWPDLLWPALLGLLAAGLVVAGETASAAGTPVEGALIFGPPALACFWFSRRRMGYSLSIALLLLAGTFYRGENGRLLYAARSFFGVSRVTLDVTGSYHVLFHGKTIHGLESVDPARRDEPLAYYHRTGPAGQVLSVYAADPAARVAVVGLGAGSLSSYAQPGQPWTYFEIDPVVLRIARDPRYFTFLQDSPGVVNFVLGDARRSLEAEPDGKFNVIVLDAYSSDAIPVHLVTREALAVYLRKLAPAGILAFHISNSHLDLEPVFGNLAHDAGLVAFTRADVNVSRREVALGKAPSTWLVMARRGKDIAALTEDPRWRASRRDSRKSVWTDDYSSVFSVFLWN